MWCCLEMAGPESQSSSAGAAIKGFYRILGSCVLVLVYFWLDLAHREDAENNFIFSVSQAGTRLPV